MLFKDTKAFSSFSVDDIEKAKEFYSEKLGLRVKEITEGLELHLLGGEIPVLIYPSSDYHAPEHTLLNFIVDDIDEAANGLAERGIKLEHYDLPDIMTNAEGMLRNSGNGMGPKAIAWFKDPAGDILSILQEK